MAVVEEGGQGKCVCRVACSPGVHPHHQAPRLRQAPRAPGSREREVAVIRARRGSPNEKATARPSSMVPFKPPAVYTGAQWFSHSGVEKRGVTRCQYDSVNGSGASSSIIPTSAFSVYRCSSRVPIVEHRQGGDTFVKEHLSQRARRGTQAVGGRPAAQVTTAQLESRPQTITS